MNDKKVDKKIPIRTSDGIRYVDESDVIHFSNGILGFESFTDFVIFNIEDCKPFKSMLSVKDGGPDFVVVETRLIFEDYDPLSITNIEEVGLGTPIELVTLSIVTLAEQPEDITINLSGPLFINLKNSQGSQVVLNDENLSTRQALMAEA